MSDASVGNESDVVKVDIWSDVARPWRFIGKRRFESAAAVFAADGGIVDVDDHSFELAVDTPVDFSGNEVDFLVRHKGKQTEMTERPFAAYFEQGRHVGRAEYLADPDAEIMIDGRFGVLGAQDPAMLVEVLNQARSAGRVA